MMDSTPLTEKEGIRLSLKEILGIDFDKFLQDFVYKPIESWANAGKINVITLKRLNKLLAKHGNKIFDVPVIQLPYATKHTVEGGELYRVRLPITKDLVIDNFVKMFSSEEAYRRAVETQEVVDAHVKGSELENITVPLSFKNDKKLMVSYPMINASSLADALPNMSHEQKEDALKKIIDTYQRFSLNLTKNSSIFKDDKGRQSLESLMKVEVAFDKLFFSALDVYAHTKALYGIIMNPIRRKVRGEMNQLLASSFSELNTSNKYVIHKDLNPGNVLISDGGVKIIDFEGLSMGFLEFDYAKLLTKAEVSPEAEEGIVRWAAQNKAKLEGRKASEKEINDSVHLYELNRIVQELFTAARYLKRSHPIESYSYDLRNFRKVPNRGFSWSMHHMADVSYTLALRRIERAIRKGILSEGFQQKISEYLQTFKESLTDLGNKLDEYMEKYNPHAQGSQENIASVQTLDAIVETDGKGMDKELEKLKKNLAKGKNKSNWIKRAAYAVIPFALLSIATGLKLYFTSKNANKTNITLVQTTEDLDLSRRIIQLNAVREAPVSTDTIFSRKYLVYLYEVYKDSKTAELFFITPNLAYEAMKETGSTKYDVLDKYMQEHHPKVWSGVFAKITGYVDNWAWSTTAQDMKRSYEITLEEAKQAYEAKKHASTAQK